MVCLLHFLYLPHSIQPSFDNRPFLEILSSQHQKLDFIVSTQISYCWLISSDEVRFPQIMSRDSLQCFMDLFAGTLFFILRISGNAEILCENTVENEKWAFSSVSMMEIEILIDFSPLNIAIGWVPIANMLWEFVA